MSEMLSFTYWAIQSSETRNLHMYFNCRFTSSNNANRPTKSLRQINRRLQDNHAGTRTSRHFRLSGVRPGYIRDNGRVRSREAECADSPFEGWVKRNISWNLGEIRERTLTNELNHVVEATPIQSSNGEACERQRETYISNEIFARVVVFIENNTVVVVTRKFGLRTSNIRELLEKQGTLDILTLMLEDRKSLRGQKNMYSPTANRPEWVNTACLETESAVSVILASAVFL